MVSVSCFLHTAVLLMPSDTNKIFSRLDAAELLRGDGCAPRNPERHSSRNRARYALRNSRSLSTGLQNIMDNLSGYAHRPFPFVLRYLRQRRAAHAVILTAVVAAVACSVGTQYGVKNLVDSLSAGPSRAGGVWLAFVFLMSLIAADNFLWRVASWTASFTFVGVTGDLAPRHVPPSDRSRARAISPTGCRAC